MAPSGPVAPAAVSVTAARPRCADVAAAAGDPLEGTAPPAEQWLLVEHPGPWDRYVLADPRLDRTAAVALDRWARAESGRVLFVRRPDRPGRVPAAAAVAPGGLPARS